MARCRGMVSLENVIISEPLKAGGCGKASVTNEPGGSTSAVAEEQERTDASAAQGE